MRTSWLGLTTKAEVAERYLTAHHKKFQSGFQVKGAGNTSAVVDRGESAGVKDESRASQNTGPQCFACN